MVRTWHEHVDDVVLDTSSDSPAYSDLSEEDWTGARLSEVSQVIPAEVRERIRICRIR